MSENKKPEDARKLTEEEMEAAKGGSTFATLSTFSVTSNFSAPTVGSIVPQGQTVMCGGQTRGSTTSF